MFLVWELIYLINYFTYHMYSAMCYFTTAKSKRSSSVSVKASTAVLTDLPAGVTKKQIYKRCRKVGEVVNITYPVEGRDSNTALVQYSNHQATTKAISALNGKTFKGMNLLQYKLFFSLMEVHLLYSYTSAISLPQTRCCWNKSTFVQYLVKVYFTHITHVYAYWLVWLCV